MLKFQASDPYPLLNGRSPSYSEILDHSAAVDAWHGLRVATIESELMGHGCRSRAPEASGEPQQLWLGLDTRSLLTPYTEIRSMLHRLAPPQGSSIADLGAGYARMGFVIGRHHADVEFIGYEYVGERVREARRCLARFNYESVKVEHADLSATTFRPEPADIYFIYDYGTPKAIEKTLHDLRRISRERPLTIVGRGRHCRMAIETRHSWLMKKYPTEPEGRFTVYVSEPTLVANVDQPRDLGA